LTGAECDMDCVDALSGAMKGCPCQENCEDGCTAQGGCPDIDDDTPGFSCDPSFDDLHILMVSQAAEPRPEEIRLSLTFDYGIEEEHYVDFMLDSNFQSYRTENGRCAVNIKNQMFIFGSAGESSSYRHYFEVLGYNIAYRGNTNYNHKGGVCASFSDTEAMLCGSSYNNYKSCEIFNGQRFTSKAELVNTHYAGGEMVYHISSNSLGEELDSVLVLGGQVDAIELYDISENTWDVKITNSLGDHKYYSTAANIRGVVYIFGGRSTADSLTTTDSVATLNENFELSTLAQKLVRKRQMHTSIIQGDRVVHIGGFPRTGEDPLYTIEVWERNLDGTFEIFESNQKLNGWFQPLCFFVGEDDYPIV